MAAKLTTIEFEQTGQPRGERKIAEKYKSIDTFAYTPRHAHGNAYVVSTTDTYTTSIQSGVAEKSNSWAAGTFIRTSGRMVQWSNYTILLVFTPISTSSGSLAGYGYNGAGSSYVEEVSLNKRPDGADSAGAMRVTLRSADGSRFDFGFNGGAFSVGIEYSVLIGMTGASTAIGFINGTKAELVVSGSANNSVGVVDYPFAVGCFSYGAVGYAPDNMNGVSGGLAWVSLFAKIAKPINSCFELAQNPWQIFEPEEIPLFKPITSGVVTLAILEALHGHTGDNIAFSLDTLLSAQDSAHTHAADNLSLSLDTFLSAQDASHTHSSENLTLDTSTTISLIISEAFHGLSSDVISFITGSYLQVADALHGHSADALTLATASFLAVANALHSHAADNLTLDTSNATTLAPQDSAHAHSADNTALTLDTWLAIVEAIHAQSADNVSISSEELLSVADALHSLASDALVLSLPSAPGTCPTAAEIAAAVLAAAQITPIYSDIRKVNNMSVNGSGTDGDPWGPV